MIARHYEATLNVHRVTMFLEEAAPPSLMVPMKLGFSAIASHRRIPTVIDTASADGHASISVANEESRRGPLGQIADSVRPIH